MVMMYTNENKGSFPQMALGEDSYPNGHWGRPTIFPAGGYSPLVPYFANFGATQTLPNSELFSCPDFQDQLSLITTSNNTYRYNGILGGQDKAQMQRRQRLGHLHALEDPAGA